MKRKPIETPYDMIDHLHEWLVEDANLMRRKTINELEESTEFSRGRMVGYSDATDEFLDHLKDLDKGGIDKYTVEDWKITKIE